MSIVSKIWVKTTPFRYALEGVLYRCIYDAKVLCPLRGTLAGRPALVVGNGPSLKRTPLDDFRGVHSFGMNKINLLFPKVQWRPSMILCTNNLVVQQNRDFFAATDIPVYLSWKARWFMRWGDRKKVGYFLQLADNRFSEDLPAGLGQRAQRDVFGDPVCLLHGSGSGDPVRGGSFLQVQG